MNAATYRPMGEAHAALAGTITSRLALSAAERAACAAVSLPMEPVRVAGGDHRNHGDNPSDNAHDHALRAALSADERAACAVLARLLQSAALMAQLGLAMTALAALVLLLKPDLGVAAGALLGAALVAGAADRYYALRLRLDAGLFADLAHGHIASLEAMDAALGQLGLRQTGNVTRGLRDRMRGAKGLLCRHAGVLGVQTLLLIAAGLS